MDSPGLRLVDIRDEWRRIKERQEWRKHGVAFGPPEQVSQGGDFDKLMLYVDNLTRASEGLSDDRWTRFEQLMVGALIEGIAQSVTIVPDRYSSGGWWAVACGYEDVPIELSGDDTGYSEFTSKFSMMLGYGHTPNEALNSLNVKLARNG